MRPRAMLGALLLASPGLGQSLLDLLVAHAAEVERPLLVHADVAADLQGVRPDPPQVTSSRAVLERWLADRGVALTRLSRGGLVVYRRGGERRKALLERCSRLVDPEDLVLAGTDLVWCVDPRDACADEDVEVRVTHVVEIQIGSHRVFGGAAHDILARLGRPPFVPPVSELVEHDGPPRLGGETLAQRVRSSDGDDVVYTYTDETFRFLSAWRAWSEQPLGATLEAFGVLIDEVGPEPIAVLQLRERPHRREKPAGPWDLDALANLAGDPHVCTLIELQHLEPRVVTTAVSMGWQRGRDATLSIHARGNAPRNVLVAGNLHAVRLWAEILARVDTPD